MVDATVHTCRDEALIPASSGDCFALLCDLATYPRWWTLVSITPLGARHLAPRVRFRFGGARPGGAAVSWIAEVLEVERERRIELAYAEGDLLGSTAFELRPEDG